MKRPCLLRFRTDRSGVSALIFAVSCPALMGIVALAVDLAGATAAKTQLDLAADTAALTAGITAAQAWESGTTNSTATADADGVAAGQQRFAAQAGILNNVTVALPLTVIVVPTIIDNSVTAFTATLTYTATYTPYFGKLVGLNSIPISSTSVVNTPVTAPYLNVYVLLDNSGSMEIAAQPSDIQTLQELTACADTGAYYCTAKTNGNCTSWSQSNALVRYSNQLPIFPDLRGKCFPTKLQCLWMQCRLLICKRWAE